MREELAALLQQFVAFSDDRLGGGGPEANDQLGPHQRKFGFQPGSPGDNLDRGWLLMNSPLPALFELEVLHGIREINISPRDFGLFKCAVQQFPGRAHERFSGQVFPVSGLFAYHYDTGRPRSFAEHGLCSVSIQVASLAPLGGRRQFGEVGPSWQKRSCPLLDGSHPK